MVFTSQCMKSCIDSLNLHHAQYTQYREVFQFNTIYPSVDRRHEDKMIRNCVLNPLVTALSMYF